MSRRAPHQRIPIWAYLVLNVLVLLVLVAMYNLSIWYSFSEKYFSAGIFPVLATCYAAFTIVCLYDAIYDRISSSEVKKKPPSDTPKSTASTSREVSKKID